MSRAEAVEQYQKALKEGQKYYKNAVSRGGYPYPVVLDDILDERTVSGRVNIGLVDIPAELVIGTKTVGRVSALAGNFMPLLDIQSEFGAKYMQNRDKAMHILQEEAELQEIVRLVGQDALSPNDRLTMETAKMIREDFLQQNAFIDEDAYSSYLKQFRLLDMVLQYDSVCREAIAAGADMNKLFNIPARERIGRAKMVPQDEVVAAFDGIIDEMKAEIAEIAEGGEDE